MTDEQYREDIQIIDRELRNHYMYKRKLEEVSYRIAEIDAQLTSIGSPRIMSEDEAKYQKGTKIYSNLNMLDLFQEQDDLMREKQDLIYLISRVQVKLNLLNDEEIGLIEKRYRNKKTLRELAIELCSNKDTIYYQIEKILAKLKK
ncbi:MAG: hypothetical protein HXN67_09715 [Prevotella pallens]|jgi:hypothetical protein|nr:hypothetical protein [Prevotella pallens]DAX17019.1 MAG TPA: Protein of unknown function (DUF1492) [Caudoviricetes sp.]